VLVLARVGGIFAVGPIFSSRVLPARARSLIAMALAFALTPIATHGRVVPSGAIEIGAAISAEIIVGLAFALTVAAVIAAVQAAGSLVDTLVGFGFAGIVDPVSNVQGSVFTRLYSLFATLIFLLTGGDRMMIAGLAHSYTLIPLGEHLDAAAGVALAVDGVAHIFLVGLQLAAPIVVAVFLTDAAFGIVARAVPQMNVLIVGMPAKILISFTVAAAALPFFAMRVGDDLGASVLRALNGLVP
jgi:flagellar biosynthesis protein FliR